MTSPLLPVYHRTSLVMQRGEGVYLFDDTGKRYLDFAAGIAVNSLGHCHPHVVEALTKQAKTLWHCSNQFHTRPLDTLAQRLAEHTFAEKIFFCNSGVEAVECGIKMIRRYHYMRGDTARNRIITVQGSFHGRSLAAISASQSQRVTEGYGPLLDGFDQVPFGDTEALERAITHRTGGIMLETIQGEGGVREITHNYLRALRRIADENGLLLFLDEVQCGMGRAGKLFAFEYAGITPDICSVAKGIGTGFPLGACLSTDKAASGMTPGSHGSTYSGNALAMAVGNAVLDVLLEKDFITNVARTGAMLRLRLDTLAKAFPHIIEEARGVGLMLGLKLKVKNTDMVKQLRQNGLLTVSAWDNVIRIVPPLIITEAHSEEAVNIIRTTCEAWS